MKRPVASLLFLAALALALGPGCALFSKGEQRSARYFSIELTSDLTRAVAPESNRDKGEPTPLYLGRVTGALHLEERLVFRSSPHEVGYYQDLRWMEPPERFLERQLARTLFEERGLHHVMGGAGPMLDVQLTALDEIRGPERLARAQVVARLRDHQTVLWEAAQTVERPIAETKDGDLAAATVEALGEAMKATIVLIADNVERELQEHR